MLGCTLFGCAAIAAGDAVANQIRDWCAAECKTVDSKYVAPKNLKNKDSSNLTIIIKCEIHPDHSVRRIRPVMTLKPAERGPYETDLYYLETAAIEAIQNTVDVTYPAMPLKPNSTWTMTYTRQPTKVPKTKVELEQTPLVR
jgi:hypothetical protein